MFPFNEITIPFIKGKSYKQRRELQYFKEVMLEIPSSDIPKYLQNKNENFLLSNTPLLKRKNK